MTHQPHSISSTTSGPGGATGLRPGDKLDKYTIIEQIGAGGMAIVWKGHDPVLDRLVAIKEFNVAAIEAQSQELANRFRGEADLQKKLARSSPHLVQVFDFLDENRGLFIIMEYVEGMNLEQMMIQNPAPMEQRQALGVVGAAALALGVIHKHNVVHRDLKPSNILLPAGGGLKVSDFGLATLMGNQDAMSVGTVRYMAPELFREETVDGRADIYSLGMIAYEMLAGREKFNEAFKVVLRDTRNQALRWMKWHTNPRAKAPPLSQINPDIPPALSDLVARMMEKDAASRVASTQELIDAMRRLFAPNQNAGTAATAAAPSQQAVAASANPTAALPKSKKKLSLILASVLVVQMLIIGGIVMYQKSQEAAAVRAHAERGQAIYNQARDAYTAGNYEQAQAGFEEVAQGWADHTQLHAAAQAGVHLVQARMGIDQGDFNEALKQIELARAFNVIKPATLDNLRQEAQSMGAFQGEMQAINDMMDRGDLGMAATRLEKLTGSTATERDMLQTLNNRLQGLQANARETRLIEEGRRERQANGLEAGIRYLELQLAARPSQRVREVVDEWKQESRYDALMTRARQFESQGKLDEAIAAFTQAQQIRNQSTTTQHIRTLRIRSLLARAQQFEQSGNSAGALNLYTEILGLDKDNEQAKAAMARIDVSNRRQGFMRAAQAALDSRQFDQAIQQFQNARDISDDQAARDGQNTARLLQAIELAQAALEANNLDKARTHINAALALSPNNEQAVEMRSQLENRQQYIRHLSAGDAFKEQAKYSEAQREYLRAQRIARTPQVAQKLADTETLQMLAQSRYYISKEEWRTARAMLKALLEKRPHEEAQQLLIEVNKKIPLSPEEENAN